MATLEKPKQKKSKKPTSSSKLSDQTKSKNAEKTVGKHSNNDNAIDLIEAHSSKDGDIKHNSEAVVIENDSLKNKIPSNENDQDNIENKIETFTNTSDIKINSYDSLNFIACDINTDTTSTIVKNDFINNIPTAPVLSLSDDNLTAIVSYPQLSQIFIEQNEPKSVENKSHIKCNDKIKPFTELQLSALYKNDEIEASVQFTRHFIENELRGVNVKKHCLYELICAYIKCRHKLKENSLELIQLKDDYKCHQNNLWIIETASVSGKTQCHDGCNVNATHQYKTAKFQRNLLENLIHVQNKIKKIVNEIHSLCAYNCNILELKIERYLTNVVSKCKESFNLTASNTSVKLNEHKNIHADAECTLKELRACISVLFYFQRQLHKDKEFVTNIRKWLSDTVSVLLRVANWQDHVYILNHVLRCPAGIHTWAINFIQVPQVPFNHNENELLPFANNYINHMITILNIILLPIEKREIFLEEILTALNDSTTSDVKPENVWVLVDSDGESDDENSFGILSLKENDLVALLNQIPLDDLFRCILLVIKRKDNCDIFLESKLSSLNEHHMLRLFAFCSVLVKLLNNGIKTYSLARYNQFIKRLCRLIRHVLQYVSDLWEVHYRNCKHHDNAMLNRLQTEFDALFLRTAKYLRAARDFGAWQFLAVVPFHMISIKNLWHFFYLLHQHNNNDDDDVDDDIVDGDTDDDDIININKIKTDIVNIRKDFSERLTTMSTEQSYYLLNTFGNMIMARTEIDDEFIQFATLNLLQIGLAKNENQESCRRCTVILLTNITNRYPKLLSIILSMVKEHLNELDQLIFLFNELSLHLWCPTDSDINIISNWLLEKPLDSMESFLARKILINLNWNFSSNTSTSDNDGVIKLFLPLNLHQHVAVLLIKTVEKYTSLQTLHAIDYNWLLVTPMAALNVEQCFVKFVWTLLFRLRLHATSRNTISIKNVPSTMFYDVIQRGIRSEQKSPLTCYCALVLTEIGHLLPLVCSDGLSILEYLISIGCYVPALVALYQIVPLFLDNVDTLLMCTSYKTIIQSLLNADKTYIKMARNLLNRTDNSLIMIIKQFGNCIEMHINNPGWQSLMLFWLKTLTSITNWTTNNNVLYLLNIIVRKAFFTPEQYKLIKEYFNELLYKITNTTSSSSSSSASSFTSWLPLIGGGGGNNSSSSGASSSLLLPNSPVLSNEPWLAYLIITLEHEHVEIRSGLWQQLLLQLYANNTSKTNVDGTLKKAANIVKVSSFNSNGLCIYRWCQLALDTALEHPLLPLIWQQFFTLYLARVPGTENRGSVGNKFFDGVINTSYLKKLKKRLQEAIDYFKNKLESLTSESFNNVVDEDDDDEDDVADNNRLNMNDDNKVKLYQRCLNLFKAYILWLEEPILMEPTLYLPSLPPQYESRYLSIIIQNTTCPWIELIDFSTIQKSFQQCYNEWMQLQMHPIKIDQRQIVTSKNELDNPIDRILRRLTSYDKPVAAPKLSSLASNVLPIQITSTNSIASTMRPFMKQLKQFAEIYSLQKSEHETLENQYKNLLPKLYSNYQTSVNYKKTCKSTCSGAGLITVNFCEARVNDVIQHQVQTNRNNFSALLTRSLQPPIMDLCSSSASLEYTVECLKQQYLIESINNSSPSSVPINTIGVELFYYLLQIYNDDEALKMFPPTQCMLKNCIQLLGQTFILGIETELIRLCRKILQLASSTNSDHLLLLLPHFVLTTNISTEIFLQMYEDICKKIETLPQISFALLSNFDINNWLMTKRPRLIDRSKFIQLVFQSLCKFSNNNTSNISPASSSTSPASSSSSSTSTSSMLVLNKNQVLLHDLFRRHLLAIFRYDFPNHYGEILMKILQLSGQQQLSIVIWLDIINCLANPVCLQLIDNNDSSSSNSYRDSLREYAQTQRMLQQIELEETLSKILTRYFIDERLQYGLYGLYPKYRAYIDSICLFLGQIIHAFIVTTINVKNGQLADILCTEILWPRIIETFGPWLVPYAVSECRDTAATWIQQLLVADERAILLPWIQADIVHAQKLFNMLTYCISFITDTLPACKVIYSYLWQFYATHFAHTSIKEHILTVVHTSLLTSNIVDWSLFWPTLTDLEIMLRIADQYLPECHAFLGHVFFSINWSVWLQHFINQHQQQQLPSATHVITRAHHCLLNLFVKLSKEPTVRQSDKARIQIDEAQFYKTWQHQWLSIETLEQLFDWYVMSIDPRIIFYTIIINGNNDIDENDKSTIKSFVKQIDRSAFKLMTIASSFYCNNQQPPQQQQQQQITLNHIKKQQCFIRAYIKLLINCSTRYKQLLTTKPVYFEAALKTQLNQIDSVIGATINNRNLSVCNGDDDDGHLLLLLVREYFNLFNNCSNCLSNIALRTTCDWLKYSNTHTSDKFLLSAILKIIGTCINNTDTTTTLLEQTLTTFFNDNTSSNNTTTTSTSDGDGDDSKQSINDDQWDYVISIVNIGPQRQQPSIEQVLVDNGRLLTLYVVLNQKLNLNTNKDDKTTIEAALANFIHWLTLIKKTETIETKLPLLWIKIIKLALNVCHLGDEEIVSLHLRKFVQQHLLPISENKINSNTNSGSATTWGRSLLGAIGLVKQESVSINCRLMCKSFAGYVLAQLPESKGQQKAGVRCFAGASGPVGQPGGNTDCAKVLLKLDVGGSTQEHKHIVEMVLKQVQDPQNSLHNAEEFLYNLVNILYPNQSFLTKK